MSSKKRLVLIAALLISITGFMVWRYSDGHRPARPSMPRLKGSGKALGFSRLIAHAGGQIQSRVYTNSRQALTRSYQNGFRFIEIDLDWTSDQELVLIHDWDKTLQKYCNRKPGACSLAEFRGLTLEYGLTQLTLDDLAQWMRKFPDVYIVTDIKRDNLRALEKIRAAYPELTARYIPQIYRFEEYSPVRSLGYENIILTLYRSSYRDEEI
ncbi:MAG: glycerophosphodiester phosphodiesterase family protein, partial [Candidatus Omnitrophica bacterium]|nr:glycerophosphodiester phosphodiesterase family protein [Candidatus Omnitrophota bacterium]